MKKFAIHSAVVAVLLYGIFFVLDKWYTQTVLNHSPEKLHWIMKLKGGNYDFAATGSSRVESMLDIETIQNNAPLRGLNIGLNGTSIQESLISVHHFLKNNKCKVLLIHADAYQFTPQITYSYPFHEYKYIPYYGDSITDVVLKDNVPVAKYYFWHYIPFFAYAEYNTEYNVLDVLKKFRNKEHPYDQFGTRLSPTINSSPDLQDKRWDAPRPEERIDTNIIDKRTIPYFEAIIEECKKNGTVPVLYTPPTYYKALANNKDTKAQIKALCAKYNIYHLDMSGTEVRNHGEYFNDYTHLNTEGTKLYCKELGDSLVHVMKQLNIAPVSGPFKE